MESSVELVRTIWECWGGLLRDAIWLGRALAPLAAGYGVLYAVTAGLFLMTLRIKSSGGKLSVRKDSTAFFLAHPMSKFYGTDSVLGYDVEDEGMGRFKKVPTLRYPNTGNICAFYARLFNMLLFVWPFLALYLLVITVVGPVIGLLLFSSMVYVDFSEEMFYRTKPVYWFRGKATPMFFPALLVFLLVGAVVRFTVLVAVLKTVAWFLVCAVPVFAGLTLLGYGGTKLYLAKQGDGSTASAVKELAMAKKARFCKLLEFN